MAAILVATGCSQQVAGNAMAAPAVLPSVTATADWPPFTDVPSTTAPTQGKYPIAERNKFETVPPPADSDEACDLLSWDAFDKKVWPVKNTLQPQGPRNPPDATVSVPHVKWLTAELTGARMCRLDNSLLGVRRPRNIGDPSTPQDDPGEDTSVYFIVNSVLWNQLEIPNTKVTVSGKKGGKEQIESKGCKFVVERGDTRLAILVTNNRFLDPGFEPCTLAQKAMEWALARH